MTGNNDFDKWITNSINDGSINDYLYDLYCNSPSKKADVRMGFIKFTEITGLKHNKSCNSAILYSCISIALASVVLAMFLLFQPKPVVPNWTSMSTTTGEWKDMVLSDGTSLHLGPCSNVVYPDVFSGSVRQIYAVGDVYFDVAKDESHPFVVSSSGTSVKVYGTLFHIYAFPGIEDQEISLAKGSVSVSLRDMESEIFLEPGEILKYNKGRNVFVKSKFDVDSFRCQMSGEQIFFDNESLISVAQKLSNRFGERVVVCDNSLIDQKYYASFVNSESLTDILSALSKKGDFSFFQINGDYYINK